MEEVENFGGTMRHHHSHRADPAPIPTTERTRRSERGAGLVEYALLLALIAVVTFGAVSFFGSANEGGYGKSQRCIEAAYSNTLGSECPPP
jgi:Flp pilus assembly pilin Flp